MSAPASEPVGEPMSAETDSAPSSQRPDPLELTPTQAAFFRVLLGVPALPCERLTTDNFIGECPRLAADFRRQLEFATVGWMDWTWQGSPKKQFKFRATNEGVSHACIETKEGEVEVATTTCLAFPVHSLSDAVPNNTLSAMAQASFDVQALARQCANWLQTHATQGQRQSWYVYEIRAVVAYNAKLGVFHVHITVVLDLLQ